MWTHGNRSASTLEMCAAIPKLPTLALERLTEHLFPSEFIPPDAELCAGTHERQPEQLWFSIDLRKQVGVGDLEVLEPGINVGRTLAIHQLQQSEPIDESLDFAGRHRLPIQIDEMNRDAALFEESLGRARGLRVLYAENLDVDHRLGLGAAAKCGYHSTWRFGSSGQRKAHTLRKILISV